MKKKLYEIFILISYVSMCIIFFIVNFTSGQKADKSNILISLILLGISGMIFLFTEKHYFIPVNHMIDDLIQASEKIKIDSENNSVLQEHEYEKGSDLFSFSLLQKLYDEYKEEIKRLNYELPANYRCNIDDYINYALIDETINKNLLNLIPGVMTGLGILGTFVGLSLGLQNFNTGTADEITRSIPLLMDGIKVAFHTSVYGMIFSLVFNYVYKKKLQNSYAAMQRFLFAYEKYVCPNNENDAINRMMDYQNKQTQLMQSMAESIGNAVGNKIRQAISPSAATIDELFSPQFQKMNDMMENFIEASSRTQVEGINEMVDKFISSMNSALGQNFSELGIVLEQTTKLQREQCDYLDSLLHRIGDLANNIQELNSISENTITATADYVQQIQDYHQLLQEWYQKTSMQMDINNQLLGNQQQYLDSMVTNNAELTEHSQTFITQLDKQIQVLDKISEDVLDRSRIEVENIVNLAEDCTAQMQDAMISSFDKQLQLLAETRSDAFNSMSDEMDKITRLTEEASTRIAESTMKCYESLTQKDEEIQEQHREQLQQVLDASKQISEDFENTRTQLKKMLHHLEESLSGSLEQTFDAFDTNLAEIAHHLSGTISQVNDTTDRVPQVVASSYDAMEKTFNDTQKQLQLLIKSMEMFQKGVNERLKLLNIPLKGDTTDVEKITSSGR